MSDTDQPGTSAPEATTPAPVLPADSARPAYAAPVQVPERANLSASSVDEPLGGM